MTKLNWDHVRQQKCLEKHGMVIDYIIKLGGIDKNVMNLLNEARQLILKRS